MNFIHHVNGVMEKFALDKRLNPSHISLYWALFATWNMVRFKNPISIARAGMMELSKIGSRNTYTKCLKELSTYGYIRYEPSHHPLKGSIVYLLSFDKSSGNVVRQDLLKNDKSTGKALSPYINSRNIDKQIKERETGFHTPTKEVVVNFFKKNIQEQGLKLEPVQEGKKFFNHYSANGWRVGRNPMQDWKAAAENWIIKSIEFQGSSAVENHLHTYQDKDYGEPL